MTQFCSVINLSMKIASIVSFLVIVLYNVLLNCQVIRMLCVLLAYLIHFNYIIVWNWSFTKKFIKICFWNVTKFI